MSRLLVLLTAVLMAGCSSTSPGSLRAGGTSRTIETQRTMVSSAETMIPYSAALTYPADWGELSRRRSGE